jgi:hypothetical protein
MTPASGSKCLARNEDHMTWRSAHYIEHPAVSAFAAAAHGTAVALRTLHEISAWDTTSWRAPVWKHTLVNDKTIGGKSAVCVGETVITYADPPQEQELRHLVAMNIRSGAIEWEREVRLVVSHGGVLQINDLLYIHGYDLLSEQYVLQARDPRNGEILSSAASIELRSAAATTKAIFVASPAEVIAHPLHDLEQITRFAMLNSTLCAGDDALYAHFIEQRTNTFRWWEGLPSDERARSGIPAIPLTHVAGAFLAPLQTAGQVAFALYEQGLGVWGIDIGQRKAIWHSLGETSLVSSLTATTHGVIARIQGAPPVYSIDPRDGRPDAIQTKLFVTNAVFWLNNQLIVTGLDEAEIFIWQA